MSGVWGANCLREEGASRETPDHRGIFRRGMKQYPPATFYQHSHDGRDEVFEAYSEMRGGPHPNQMVQAMRHMNLMQTTAHHDQACPGAPKGHHLVATAEMGSGKTKAQIPLCLCTFWHSQRVDLGRDR